MFKPYNPIRIHKYKDFQEGGKYYNYKANYNHMFGSICENCGIVFCLHGNGGVDCEKAIECLKDRPYYTRYNNIIIPINDKIKIL